MVCTSRYCTLTMPAMWLGGGKRKPSSSTSARLLLTELLNSLMSRMLERNARNLWRPLENEDRKKTGINVLTSMGPHLEPKQHLLCACLQHSLQNREALPPSLYRKPLEHRRRDCGLSARRLDRPPGAGQAPKMRKRPSY